MIMEYVRLRPHELVELRRMLDEEPDSAYEYAGDLRMVDGDEPVSLRGMDTDKAWAGLQWLLTKLDPPVDVFGGGEPMTDDEWGYDSPRLLAADDVVDAARFLTATPFASLTALCSGGFDRSRGVSGDLESGLGIVISGGVLRATRGLIPRCSSRSRADRGLDGVTCDAARRSASRSVLETWRPVGHGRSTWTEATRRRRCGSGWRAVQRNRPERQNAKRLQDSLAGYVADGRKVARGGVVRHECISGPPFRARRRRCLGLDPGTDSGLATSTGTRPGCMGLWCRPLWKIAGRFGSGNPPSDSYKIWPRERAMLRTCPRGCGRRPGPPCWPDQKPVRACA